MRFYPRLQECSHYRTDEHLAAAVLLLELIAIQQCPRSVLYSTDLRSASALAVGGSDPLEILSARPKRRGLPQPLQRQGRLLSTHVLGRRSGSIRYSTASVREKTESRATMSAKASCSAAWSAEDGAMKLLAQPVKKRVCRFVCDDVVRQAQKSVRCAAGTANVAEQQSFSVGGVERIRVLEGVGHDLQLMAPDTPPDTAAQRRIRSASASASRWRTHSTHGTPGR